MFLIIFGLFLRRSFITYDFENKSTFWFLIDNYDFIGGILFGVGLLFAAVFLKEIIQNIYGLICWLS